MLESLYLRDFVIVDKTEIEFSSGFCVLSGETGAGKSILLDALGLALGNRADGGMVRQGAKQTEISASFTPSWRVQRWLAEHSLATDDDADETGVDGRDEKDDGRAGGKPRSKDVGGELRLRRLVMTDGRSKAFINGSPVTIGQLRELGRQLIEIHGQHASQSLLTADGQRHLLDDYAQSTPQAEAVRAAWTQWRDARRLLERAASRQDEMGAERDELQWRVDEVAAIAPQPGEWQQLSAEQTRLANGAELVAVTQGAASALVDTDDSLSDQLRHLIARLRQQSRADASLDPVLEMLESAQIQIVEAASELSAYADRLDLDPRRLEHVEARVGAMFALARKLRCEPEELAEKAQDMMARLSTLDSAQDLDRLQREVDDLGKAYFQAAGALGRKRREAALALSASVASHLAGLGMPAARFAIAVDDNEPGPNGTDRIEFQFAGHGSLAPRALSRVASGGELSRVSLAIAVSAAKANPVDSMIFDEADAGVGGAVADAIGLLMRDLGNSRQVLAVTHLPQVAARAHRHFRIERENTANGINSRVDKLNDEARIDEIARMLGGAKVTATTRDHASEMITLADAQPSAGLKKKTVRPTRPLAGAAHAALAKPPPKATTATAKRPAANSKSGPRAKR